MSIRLSTYSVLSIEQQLVLSVEYLACMQIDYSCLVKSRFSFRYNPRDLVSEVAGTLAHPVSPSLDWTYTPSIMLYPAPGEIFPLNIRFKDIYVNEIFELAKIWVKSLINISVFLRAYRIV